MYIRRFLIIFISTLLILSISTILIYQYVMESAVVKAMVLDTDSVGSFARIKDKKIQVYEENQWRDFNIKGVQVSGFIPGYSRSGNNVKKEDLMLWLGQIAEMNANVITIPSIQSVSFYNAIYDYNLKAEKPIYIIHEIPLEEPAILKHYDAYNKEIIKPLKRDIINTIDIVNGKGLVLNQVGHSGGIYLKDISAYILAYVIGTNTSSELVTLTNLNYPDNNGYEGKYFSLKSGTSFESFIAEMMDFAANYESDKYNQLSLFSYTSSIDTDPMTHKNETNTTKNANINLKNIIAQSNGYFFASYSLHPNNNDFLDFESIEIENGDNPNNSIYFDYIKKINRFHTIPVVISNVGIPSSRGMSKVDLDEGFNRGNIAEVEQGRQLVKLMDYINKAGLAGVVIYSWQDDWGKTTAFNLLEDYSDESSSTYWFNAQASDESFGLMSFDTGEKESHIYIDGDFKDWDKISALSKDDGLEVKVSSDSSYLYMMVKKDKLSLTSDKLYIGLDITPNSGSKAWGETVKFPIAADFIIDFNGYNESRIVVHERYNIFNYLYKYYSNIIEKQEKVPDKDGKDFSAIYLLNRKNFYHKEDNRILPPIYYQTGRLIYGNGNPKSDGFNSLTDFNKEGDALEIRIPWMLINIKNPLKKLAQDDFYIKGLESQIYINDINLAVVYEGVDEDIMTKALKYTIPSYKDMKYHQRLKKSYNIIKDYWQ